MIEKFSFNNGPEVKSGSVASQLNVFFYKSFINNIPLIFFFIGRGLGSNCLWFLKHFNKLCGGVYRILKVLLKHPL